MSNALASSDLHAYGDLPPDIRTEVDAWRAVCLEASEPIRRWARGVAARMGVSVGTAVRKYYAHKARGWRGLVDLAKCPSWKAKHVDGLIADGQASAEFVEWYKALCETNQRKNAPAHRKFAALWRSGASIPGLDNSLPRHELPPGCSYDRLQRRCKDAFATDAMRQGLASAVGKFGPQVFSTRVGLWVGSHLMIDDLWHDNFVQFRGKPVRVLELDLLDVFSGYKAAWGCKPRFMRDDGTMDGLSERYARLIVASHFWNHGYSPRGSTILAEHGTAAISDRVARILHDRTGGLITRRESGITGVEQAIVGFYGQGKGNFRFKAALESMRNLIHNELGDVAGQTGHDRNEPEFAHGIKKLSLDLCKAVAIVAQSDPVRARQIKNPLLDFHGEFLPLLQDVYARINQRDWHKLEGWHECGHVTTKYRLSVGGSGRAATGLASQREASHHGWLLAEEFNAQPEGIRNAVLAEVHLGATGYTAAHVMSPAEVFAQGRPSLERLPMFVVGEILADDYAAEREVKGAYFNEFSDQEIAPEPLLFESVVITPEGQREQLRDGKYHTFVNPFDPHWLFVHNAQGAPLGVAQRARKIQRTDQASLERAFGNRNKRREELLQPIRVRHAEMVREQTRIAEAAIEAIAPAPTAEARKFEREAKARANRLGEVAVQTLLSDDAPGPEAGAVNDASDIL